MTASSSDAAQASHPAAIIFGPAMPKNCTSGTARAEPRSGRRRAVAGGFARDDATRGAAAAQPLRAHRTMLRVEAAMKSTNALNFRLCLADAPAASPSPRPASGPSDTGCDRPRGRSRTCSSRKAAALEAFGIHRVRHRRIAGDHDVRRHVTLHDRAAGKKCVRADLARTDAPRSARRGSPNRRSRRGRPAPRSWQTRSCCQPDSRAPTCEYAMNRLSLPIRVTPLSCVVPRLTVQLSRNTLRSPISSRVGSPLYFLSCGASPMEANWKMRLSAPMTVGPLMTTCGPTMVPAPICTSGPMIENGPTVTSAASCACGETIALGSITCRSPAPPSSRHARPRSPRRAPWSRTSRCP